MAKFKVKAEVITYCYLEVEADSEEQAIEIGENTDGGDFISSDEGEFKVIEATKL